MSTISTTITTATSNRVNTLTGTIIHVCKSLSRLWALSRLMGCLLRLSQSWLLYANVCENWLTASACLFPLLYKILRFVLFLSMLQVASVLKSNNQSALQKRGRTWEVG